MPQISAETLAAFKAATPAQQDAALAKMSDGTKAQLLAMLKANPIAADVKRQAQNYPTNPKVGVDVAANMADSFAGGSLNPFANPSEASPRANNVMSNLLGTYDKMVGAPVRGAISLDAVKGMLPQNIMDLIPAIGMARKVAPAVAEPIQQVQKGDYSGAIGTGLGATAAAMTPGAIEGMAGTASPAISAAGNLVKRAALPAPTLNRWMEVKPTDMMHGADPGAQLIKDKLLGATKQATRNNVEGALGTVEQQLSSKLGAATSRGITIDAETPLIDALSDAENSLSGGTDAAFQNKLMAVLDKVQKKYPNLKNLTPTEAQELNVWLGNSAKWSGAPYEGEFNQALVNARGGISAELKSKVPGIGSDLTQWGNLFNATKALKRAIVNNKAGQGTSSLAMTALKRAAGPGAAIGGGYAIDRLMKTFK